VRYEHDGLVGWLFGFGGDVEHVPRYAHGSKEICDFDVTRTDSA
jgi:hypothetical protein